MKDDLTCACGNPSCNAHVQFRKGFVFFPREDGSEEVRGDYFHLDAFDYETGKEELKWVHLMMTPQQARCLMWYLVINYMPIVHRLIGWWQLYPYRWFDSFVWWVKDTRGQSR